MPILSRRTATTRYQVQPRRLPETDGAKLLLTSDQGAYTSQALTRWRHLARIRKSGLLLIYRPRRDERLSWPSWLTCIADGLPTQWSLVGCRSSAGQGQFAGQRPAFCQLCYATEWYRQVYIYLGGWPNTMSAGKISGARRSESSSTALMRASYTERYERTSGAVTVPRSVAPRFRALKSRSRCRFFFFFFFMPFSHQIFVPGQPCNAVITAQHSSVLIIYHKR